MKKLLLFHLAFCLSVVLFAQTPFPCPTASGPGADFCQFACLSCNLHGLTGNTGNFTGIQATPYCLTYEKDQWFAFVAAAPSATFTATPSNCLFGNGVQISLASVCYGAPIACDPGAYYYGNVPVSITAALTPGQVYFLMIDGFVGDSCDFVLTVNPPSATAQFPVDSVGPIDGPDTLCYGISGTFSVEPVNGAGYYTWLAPPGVLINGQTGPLTLAAPGGNEVDIELIMPFAQLCVEAGNGCATPLNTVCKTITGTQATPELVVLPPQTVCNEDLPYILPWGDSVNVGGIYEKLYSCDSLVRLQLIVKAPIIRNLPPQAICEGDSVVICGQAYHEAGSYAHSCTSYQGCDSLINFSIVLLAPEARIIAPAKGLTCAEPEILLTSAPTPGVRFWLNNQGDTLGTGNNLTVSEPGFYFLQVNATAGALNCMAQPDKILIKELTEPPPITAAGGTLTAQSPWVVLQVHSLFSNVAYSWTGPAGFASSQQNPAVSVPGTYTVTVTDLGTGCTSSAEVEVIQG